MFPPLLRKILNSPLSLSCRSFETSTVNLKGTFSESYTDLNTQTLLTFLYPVVVAVPLLPWETAICSKEQCSSLMLSVTQFLGIQILGCYIHAHEIATILGNFSVFGTYANISCMFCHTLNEGSTPISYTGDSEWMHMDQGGKRWKGLWLRIM